MKPKFQLEEGSRLHVAAVNVRRENHGDEKVRAVDLRLLWTTSNEALALFDKKLTPAFFEKQRKGDAPANDDGQTELDLPVSDLPCVRFPDLGHVRVKREYEGYVFDFDAEVYAGILRDCKVNRINYECLEGGSVIFTFRLQASGVDAEVYGALAMTLDTEIVCSLTPGEAAQQQISDGSEEQPDGDREQRQEQEQEPAGAAA